MNSVAFTTSAWQRDWTVVLDPVRYRMIVESHRHEFPIRLVVLNNFTSARDAVRARQAADGLVAAGLVTEVIVAQEVLQPAVLAQFGLDGTFWQRNPWFSTAHLAALSWLAGRADYQCYLSGDVWLERAGAWVPRALVALRDTPAVLGLNLCRNIYREGFYPRHCHRQTPDLWVSEPAFAAAPAVPRGFSLSDLAYLIPVRPEGGWHFSVSDAALAPWLASWPAYARPCFEMLYRRALVERGQCHAALKPGPGGGPITKHKNIPGGTGFKRRLQQGLGFFRPGGRFATRPD